MSKILDTEELYLANYGQAQQIAGDRTFYVNCTKDLAAFNGDDTNNCRVPVNDDGADRLLPFFAAICATITEKLASGYTVVVFCKMGQQRSAAVVAARLMQIGRCCNRVRQNAQTGCVLLAGEFRAVH